MEVEAINEWDNLAQNGLFSTEVISKDIFTTSFLRSTLLDSWTSMAEWIIDFQFLGSHQSFRNEKTEI